MYKSVRKGSLILLIVYCISFIAGPVFAQSNPNDLEWVTDGYKVGAGDVIDCHILVKNTDIAMDYTLPVSPGGAIFFPGIGKIFVAGKTLPEIKFVIRQEVSKILHEEFGLYVLIKQISSPDILNISPVRPYVYVFGEVKKASRVPYMPGSRLSDYVSIAGGPTERAALGGISITRNVNGKTQKINVNYEDIIIRGEADKDIYILENDLINVPRNVFYIADFVSLMSVVLTLVTVYSVVRR